MCTPPRLLGGSDGFARSSSISPSSVSIAFSTFRMSASISPYRFESRRYSPRCAAFSSVLLTFAAASFARFSRSLVFDASPLSFAISRSISPRSRSISLAATSSFRFSSTSPTVS